MSVQLLVGELVEQLGTEDPDVLEVADREARADRVHQTLQLRRGNGVAFEQRRTVTC